MKPKRLKIIPIPMKLKVKIDNWLFTDKNKYLSVISVQSKKSLNYPKKIFCKIKVRLTRHSDLAFVIDLHKNICLKSNKNSFNYYAQWFGYMFNRGDDINKVNEHNGFTKTYISENNIEYYKTYIEIKKEIYEIAEKSIDKLINVNPITKKIKHKSIKGRYRIERFLKRPSIKKIKEKYK